MLNKNSEVNSPRIKLLFFSVSVSGFKGFNNIARDKILSQKT